MSALRDRMLVLLKVPPRPAAPFGARDVQIFHASPRYFHYKLAIWALGQLAGLWGLLLGFYFLSRVDFPGAANYIVTGFEAVAWLGYFVQLPISFMLIRFDYEMRWYIVTDRSLRIREGIVKLCEKTMTFANIQQISVRRNPLQRLLGIADVHVETAGGSGKSDRSGNSHGESMHEARFSGVANAEQIRDTIRERVRMHRDSGLGDPDDRPDPGEALESGGAAIAAAWDLLDEVRELRATVAGRTAPTPPAPS